MDLITLFQQAPPALQACSRALNVMPGAGWRCLRQISKAMCNVAQVLILSYTLCLSGNDAMMFFHMRLLDTAMLKELRIRITGEPNDKWPSGPSPVFHSVTVELSFCAYVSEPCACSPDPFPRSSLTGNGAHLHQLKAFLAGARPAISQIDKLFISCEYAAVQNGLVTGVAELMAPVCANSLTSLHLQGHIHQQLLVAFGLHCIKLSSLVLTEGLGISSEWHLPITELMPTVTSIEFVPPPRDEEQQQHLVRDSLWIGASCLFKLATSTVTAIILKSHVLSPGTWQHLPAVLQHLECRLSNPLESEAQMLSSLHSLVVHCTNDCLLCPLAAIVQHSPALTSVKLVAHGERRSSDNGHLYMRGYSTPSTLSHLLLLDARVRAGLHLCSEYNLALSGGGRWEPMQELTDFLKQLPQDQPLLCKRLKLFFVEHEYSVPEVFPVVFESVEMVGILTGSSLQEDKLCNLARCKELVHLSLATQFAPYTKDVLLSCAHIPALKELLLHSQRDTTQHEILAFQQQLTRWGRAVRVIKYDDDRLQGGIFLKESESESE